MNNIFMSKGKLIALLMVLLVVITGVAGFFAYKTINTGIDVENLPEPIVEEKETIVETEPEKVEGDFRRPEKMRGTIIAPGIDFIKTEQDTQETIEKQIDEVIAQAKKYGINSIVINTSYNDKVIYNTEDQEMFSIEADTDILKIVSTKISSEGFYVYLLVDIEGIKDKPDAAFTAENFDQQLKSSKIYKNLEEVASWYQPDGILLTGYQNSLEEAEYAEYSNLGGGISLEEYLIVAAELNFKAAKEALYSASPDIQLGILAEPVWDNIVDNPKGSKTSAENTALKGSHVDTRRIVTENMVDFVMVSTGSAIGDEQADFKEVIHWWNSVARETDAPIYIVCAASKVNAKDDETKYGDEELVNQVKLIDGEKNLQGVVFDGLSYLENNKTSSEKLLEYYKEGSDDTEENPAENKEPQKTENKPPETVKPPAVQANPPAAQNPATPPPAAPAPVPAGITLNTNIINIRAGESAQLKATVTPSTAKQEATWASENREIAKVDANGKVTGVKDGTVKITATSADGKVATCTITVVPAKTSTGTTPGIAVEEVIISNENATVSTGATYQLSAEVRPDAATNKTVSWGSSNDDIATVDSTGKVTGVKEGNAKITVTTVDGKKTATCEVKVINSDNVGPSANNGSGNLSDTTDITISANSSNMYIDSKATLVVKNQKGQVLSNDLFTWETSDKSIARVDENGVVSTKSKGGTVTISAYKNSADLYAKFTITVSEEKIRVTGIQLSQSQISVAVGKTNSSVTATLTPSNATMTDIEWRISNSNIATVDANGVVTGKAPGSTTLVAKAKTGNIQATCKVEVTSTVKIKDIYIKDNAFEMWVGDTDYLTAIIDPSGADVQLQWTSSSPSVVEVDSKGNVTAKKEGKATITVRVVGNESYYDTCEINVV